MLFPSSYLIVADSSSFRSQREYSLPRRDNPATSIWNPTHLIHLYYIILCDFLHCTSHYLVFSCLCLLIYFSSPTTYNISFRIARNKFLLLIAISQVPRTVPGNVFTQWTFTEFEGMIVLARNHWLFDYLCVPAFPAQTTPLMPTDNSEGLRWQSLG